MHRFQPAHASDSPAIRRLLRENGLPSDDLEEVHLDRFQIVTNPTGSLIACVGLEIHGDAALLRSLAVAAPHTVGTVWVTPPWLRRNAWREALACVGSIC